MPTATDEFFTDLKQRGHESLLGRIDGSIRFDIGEGPGQQRWLIDIDHGDVNVRRRHQAADCTVHADREAFDAIVTGADNAIAALLRGTILAEGDFELLQLFQRLFPGPPDSTGPRKGD